MSAPPNKNWVFVVSHNTVIFLCRFFVEVEIWFPVHHQSRRVSACVSLYYLSLCLIIAHCLYRPVSLSLRLPKSLAPSFFLLSLFCPYTHAHAHMHTHTYARTRNSLARTYTRNTFTKHTHTRDLAQSSDPGV